ncbi:MAG: YkvA family protein [Myxococcota bacterium]|nr:YkvA family protein [Myxococcota bacterium]
MADTMKISFTLDASDVTYFRKLLKDAKSHSGDHDQASTVKKVRKLVTEVEGSKVPHFVREAVVTLVDLIQMLEDEAYALPKAEASRVLAALTYFANPADLIPDSIPGLGFLDDAIMIKIVEVDFKNELWGYRRFRKFRDGAEQRPWSKLAQERLPKRLADYRKDVRDKIKARNESTGKRIW